MRLIAISALVLGLICPQLALAENRVALVIGNGSYQKAPELSNPPRDAAAVSQAFQRLDFKVTQIQNATAQDMRKAIVDFGRAAEGSEMAVIFYAGHGMEVGGENWLIPVSAELRSDADVESEAVSLRSVSLQVAKARKLGLVILDACRNNPFAAKMKRSISARTVNRGLAPTEPSDNVLIAYAAKDGTTASDGDGRNSPFTTALLKHIETPGLEISFLFRRVRDDVMIATKREQQPFVYGSLSKEEIYLKASIKEVAATPSVAISAPQTQSAAPINEPDKSATKPSDRNLFTAEAAQKLASIGEAQRLVLPKFTMPSEQDRALNPYSKFVGIWTNKRGWGNGKGRYGMVIILDVTASGLARGYYLWGPPTKNSWVQDAAGSKMFLEYIVKDKLTIKLVPEINAVLDDKNVLTLNVARGNKSSDNSSIELRPIWQLVKLREDAGSPSKSAKPPARPSSKRETTSTPSQPVANVGTTMEERYRACKKLVTGFRRREACARTGAI